MHDAASRGSPPRTDPERMQRLLLLFGSDSVSAWEKYWDIWGRLAKYFEWNHCPSPEDLADEVLDRMAAKPEIEEIRDVDKYLFGIASFVCREVRRRMQRETHIEDLPD